MRDSCLFRVGEGGCVYKQMLARSGDVVGLESPSLGLEIGPK